jgi:hypothetical protein
VSPPRGSRAIVSTQRRGGYSAEHARWHHAAVYLGDYLVCEATLRGVRYAPIYAYVGNHFIRVRRDESLSDRDSWRVALYAMTRLKDSYSYLTIASLAFKAQKGYWRPMPESPLPGGRAVICSKLYSDAFILATKRVLYNVTAGEVTPASLSSSPIMTDVQTEWLAISD